MAFKRSRQTFEADLQKQESPFVLYGTPLPPLDEHTRDDGSFVPVWKQEVTDDRGRKRLHGAFTGGFSAGYYNTVGSKEGWTPSTFVSSRKNRAKDGAKVKGQTLEDFMDEEDVRDVEESRHLQTSDQFGGFGTEEDSKRKGTLLDVFRLSGNSIGKKLLGRMGWKEGQGIGPKVKRLANVDDNTLSMEDQQLFAPQDVSIMSFAIKNGYKGVGYENNAVASSMVNSSKLDPESEDDSENLHKYSINKAKQKLDPNRSKSNAGKSGFGVGVLNDDGSDDEDPYSMGPRISYNRVIGGDKKPKKKSATVLSNPNPLVKGKPVFVSKKISSLKETLRRCQDGKLPLDGFVLADKLDSFSSMSIQDEKYKPPDIPSTWKSSMRPEPENAEQSAAEAGSHVGAIPLNAKSRAAILGEAPLPGKSVFDFISSATRDRLVQATGKSNLPPGMGESSMAKSEVQGIDPSYSIRERIPLLDQKTARQALSRGSHGFMPYGEDEKKRQRYRNYLEIHARPRDSDEHTKIPPQGKDMTEDDWVAEMHEFARAAQVFKPVSGLMASRFTSSTSLEPPTSVSDDQSIKTSDLLTKPATKQEDPSEAAARLGLFGPMTRSILSFHPPRLLCKRLNIPMPDQPTSVATATRVPNVNRTKMIENIGRTDFDNALSTDMDHQSSQTIQIERTEKPISDFVASGESDVAIVDSHKVSDTTIGINPDENAAIEQTRPSQAIFKAIFGSDDEDEDH